MKKKIKIIFEEREKMENDLINSIMRSSEEEDAGSTPHVAKVEPKQVLPGLNKLNHKSPAGAKLKIRVENFESVSPRDLSLPRLNFSTRADGLFSVRQQKIPGFDNPISSKQSKVAKKRKSVVPQLNSLNRKIQKNNLMSETPRDTTTAPTADLQMSAQTSSYENIILENTHELKAPLNTMR
jgi:hypothetical protein